MRRAKSLLEEKGLVGLPINLGFDDGKKHTYLVIGGHRKNISGKIFELGLLQKVTELCPETPKYDFGDMEIFEVYEDNDKVRFTRVSKNDPNYDEKSSAFVVAEVAE